MGAYLTPTANHTPHPDSPLSHTRERGRAFRFPRYCTSFFSSLLLPFSSLLTSTHLIHPSIFFFIHLPSSRGFSISHPPLLTSIFLSRVRLSFQSSGRSPLRVPRPINSNSPLTNSIDRYPTFHSLLTLQRSSSDLLLACAEYLRSYHLSLPSPLCGSCSA